MPRVAAYELHAVELPFRRKFEHAASVRETSSSLFLQLTLDNGISGWGEALPRAYVTGESLIDSSDLLSKAILPRLLGSSFERFEDLISFLEECNGQAPSEWLDPETPQTASWCSVDLALLDAFGRHFSRAPFGSPAPSPPANFRYSGVLTSSRTWKQSAQLLAFRLLGFEALKLKLDEQSDLEEIKRIAQKAGPKLKLRADVNMSWDVPTALKKMPSFASAGIQSFEQPLEADDFPGAARLVEATDLGVMADESFSTKSSLEELISMKACTAVNARISKCGGLIATLARCREADAAGLTVQVGCQVGESSLLSAAHLHLCSEFRNVTYAESCFGKLLLKEDPANPLLQFRRGGAPPALPDKPGIGITIDESCLSRHRVAHWKGQEKAS